MRIAGIDPGLTGAIAIIDTATGELTIFDMPALEIAKAKGSARHINAGLLSEMIAGRQITHAAIEKVSAMPGQGVTGMFSLGRSLGVVEGVFAAYDIPTTLVPPQTWQKSYGLKGKTTDADGARNAAISLFPSDATLFARKKDNGRADAALIARWYAHVGWQGK